MKKLNLPLVLGGIILLLIVMLMIVPHFFTKVNPYGIQHIKAWSEEGGKFKLQSAPFPPSKDAILGTDELGRDVWSFIVYGTRLTITLGVLVVVGRFLIALPLGITAGFGSLISKAVINQFNVIFSAIPALLVSLIILKLDFFISLDKEQSIIAFVLVLSFVGWAKLGSIIMDRVQEILTKPFIKGEIAIGKSKFKIAIENVIPHLAAEIVVLFFMEIARALTLIMQLGIFGAFVGNLRIIEDTEGGRIIAKNISFEPEWTSMLGTARNQIRSAPWNVFSPAVAFFISVLGFNLFGEGLRNQLQKRNSKFIPALRKILSLDLKSFKILEVNKDKERKLNYKLIGTIVISLVIITGTIFVNMGKYKFSIDNSTYAFSSNLDEQALIGTEEGKELALKIADEMKSIGLKPLEGGGFIREYKTMDVYAPISPSFQVEIENEERNLVIGKDYSLLSFGEIDLSGDVYNATRDDMFNINDYTKFSDKFVLIDKAFYNDAAVKYFTTDILEKSTAKGVLCITRENEELQTSLGNDIHDGVIALLTRDMGDLLSSNENIKLNISFRSEQLNSTGRNILGIVPGEDPKVGDEAIIIGFGYNYLDKDLGEKRLQFAIELMRQLSKEDTNRNRSIIFAFWDGTLKDEYDGIRDYVRDTLYPNKKSNLYIDLSKLNSYNYDYLSYSGAQSPITRYFAWSLGHQLESNFEKENIELKEYEVRDIFETRSFGSTVDNKMFLERGIATIIIRTSNEGKEGKFNLENLGEVLTKTISENNY